MSKFRIFISYSRKDRKLAEEVVRIVEEKMGFMALWDNSFKGGEEFTETIKKYIASSHLIIPIFTKNSQKSPWVHQETVYALALGIPILPIATKIFPNAFITLLHTIVLKKDFSDAEEKLSNIEFEKMILYPPIKTNAIIEIAEFPDKRTELIARYAEEVILMNEYGCVYQRAAFSSFSIPDKNEKDPIWILFDGKTSRSEQYHKLERQERIKLEEHAKNAGLYLIIDPTLDLPKRGNESVRTRLEILLEFLESMSEDKLHIIISKRALEGNITIVGDWFMAESITPRVEGFRQTVFNRHAPTVYQRVLIFKDEFKELLEANNLDEDGARKSAIDLIKNRIRSLSQS